MSASVRPTGDSPEALLARWRDGGRPEDLAALFDRAAPELFRLALHLCPDAATAEDVLQETFLVVLERASAWDPARPAMPWLVGILKHRALMARRRSARSPDPGRLPAPATPDDPAFAAADAEERERLREAMRALPEPYRGVALLRWRYGLDPAAIAEVKGVPPATVRSWLHRAVGRLKVEMTVFPLLLLGIWPSRGLAGIRKALLRRAASRLIPGRTGAANPTAAASGATGSFTVGRAVLASSFVGLALGVAGWIVLGTDGGAPAPPVPPASAATVSGAPVRPSGPADPTAADVAAAPVVAASPPAEAFDGVEVEVLVKDAEGRPAEGAEVILWRCYGHFAKDKDRYWEEPPFPGYVKSEPATADAEGRALLRIVRGDLEPKYTYVNNNYIRELWLHVSRDRDACMVELRDLPKSGREIREVSLEPAGRLQGTLRWPAGEALAGGLVYLKFNPSLHLAVRADEHGRFRFPLVPASRFEGLRYLVRAKEALSLEQVVDRKFFDGPDLDIAAVPQWTLRGRCVDAQGAPLADLPVVARAQTSVTLTDEWSGRTAPDGTFSLGPIDGTLPTLRVDGGERGILTLGPLVSFGKDVHDLGDIRFGETEQVQGVVVRPDGTPAAGALLLLSPGRSGGDTVLAHAVADDVGRFSFSVSKGGGTIGGRAAGLQEMVVHVLPEAAAGKWRDLPSSKIQGEYFRLLCQGRMEGFRRGPFWLDGKPQRIVLGGLRVTLRCVDADTGAHIPLKSYRARLILQGTKSQAVHGHYHPNPDGTAFFFATIAGTYVPEFTMEGYEAELPETVEFTEERETVLQVKLRKKE